MRSKFIKIQHKSQYNKLEKGLWQNMYNIAT